MWARRGENVKVLLVHPGASWSTHDVWLGVDGALRRVGVEVVEFRTDGRLEASSRYLHAAWRNSKHREELIKSTAVDAIYHMGEGLVARALHFLPDWVIIVGGTYLHPDTLALLRRAGTKICAILTESPYQFEQEKLIAERVQVLFTNERSTIEKFRPYCSHIYYWQHAYDPLRHRPVQDVESDIARHDVVFVGTGFIERIRLLQRIDWAGIDFGLYGSWSLLGARSNLRKHLKLGIIDNQITAALYGKAKVGLNIHRTSMDWGRKTSHYEGAESMNPRCYELAACGCFFICDDRAEVKEMFGDLVPMFKTANEANDLIHYYLAHDAERQQRTELLPQIIAMHTFDERVEKLLGVLDDYHS